MKITEVTTMKRTDTAANRDREAVNNLDNSVGEGG